MNTGIVIQDAFFVPDNIAVGLAKGIYKRFGGVVRWAVGAKKGQIVTHLKPIKTSAAETSLAKAIIQFVSKHKTGFIIAGIATAVTATSLGIKYAINRKARKRFQRAFSRYIEAIQNQKLSLDLIENLEESLDGIKYVKMSAEELSSLIILLKEYTLQLTQSNGIQTDNLQPSGNPIVDLKKYLRAQKNVFAA